MPIRLGGLALLAILAGGASLLVGGTPLAPGDVIGALFHPSYGSDVVTIVWQLRLPRVLIAMLVGSSLSLGGALLQGMLRNPLVDPYLTGVSAGAGAAIAISILVGVAAPLAPAIGFIAGLGSAVLVAALARRGSAVDANRLILAGVSISALFSAIIALALTRAQSIDYAQQILSWLAGSMAGRGWHELAIAAPYALIGTVLAAIVLPALNTLRAGDVRARSVGLDVARTQWIILIATALLAASSVVLAGIIGFVGLIVPHLARRLVGSDARALLPACMLTGATLCTLADAIARTIVAPAELPVGVLLAVIGVPSFLYLYLRGSAQT
jgi:iron complex transport system permease protein